jgi:hypothetical protein
VLAIFCWASTIAAAGPDDALLQAVRALLAPGEGQATEAVYAHPAGAASESDLPLVARVRYTFKSPRVRVEWQAAAGGASRLLVHDGADASLATPVGATRLTDAAPEIRQSMGDALFPLVLILTGARAAGTETLRGRTAQVIEGRSPDGPWTVWLDAAEKRILRYRLRGGEQVGELSYATGGVLRRVVVRSASGKPVLVRYRDLPTRVAVEDSAFVLETARGVGDLGQALAQSLTPGRTRGPSATATAGARGVDEEVEGRQLGAMRLDYRALAEIERFQVADDEVEAFLRAGKLGRYRE